MVCSVALRHVEEHLVAVPERSEAILLPHGLNVNSIRDEQRRVTLAQGADVGEGDFDLFLKAEKIAVEAGYVRERKREEKR